MAERPAHLQTLSFWEYESLRRSYDLAVVGAGIVGLSAALFHKKQVPEARVAVFEKGFYPEGASSRNAGFACFGSVTEIADDLEHESKEEVSARIRSRLDGLKSLKTLLGEEAIGYEACGGYEIFTSDEAFELAASRIEEFNVLLESISGESDVYKAMTFNGFPAIFNRLEGALNTGKMMKALIEACKLAGVEIFWNSPVSDFGSGWLELSGKNRVQASQILLATNGFTAALTGLNIKPGRGLVYVTRPLETLPWRGTFHYDRGYVYFRNIGDRLLLGGARNVDCETEESSEFEVNSAIRDWLYEFSATVLDIDLEEYAEHHWTGIMGFADSKTAIVEQIQEGVFVAAGLGGMGVAIGVDTGRRAQSLVAKNSR